MHRNVFERRQNSGQAHLEQRNMREKWQNGAVGK